MKYAALIFTTVSIAADKDAEALYLADSLHGGESKSIDGVFVVTRAVWPTTVN